MKKIVGLIFTFVIIGCLSNNDSETNEDIIVPDTTVNWSLTGSLGLALLDSVNGDTSYSAMALRSDSSQIHLDGFDTAYFKDTILITHLQNMNSIRAKVDMNGNFKFDNKILFGFSDGGNSIRITPFAKEHTILSPESFIVFSAR